MNNSQIRPEAPQESDERRQEKEAGLVKILEAIGEVSNSPAWKILQKEVFVDVVGLLERSIAREVKAKEINVSKLYSLQGQLMWAKKYADLDELAKPLKIELKAIQKHGR